MKQENPSGRRSSDYRLPRSGLVAWPARSQSMRTSGPKARGKKGTSLGEAYARRRISIHRCSKVHGPTPARTTPQRALSCAWRPFMQDPVYVLPRIPILRRWVNKDHQARLRLLVNDEHALAKLVRCGPYAGFGIQILWSTL